MAIIHPPEVLISLPTPPLRMTWEEFLHYEDEDFYAEWVEGEVMRLNTPSTLHQETAVFLTTLMNVYASLRGLGSVLAAPYLVRLKNSARHPDVLFLARENTRRLQPEYLEGAPDIAVEILSDSTRDTDEKEKYREYEEAGVGEYWQIDPERKQAAFFRADTNGIFQPVPLADGLFTSEVLTGFVLRVDYLWQDPLPPVTDALREMGVL